MDKRCCKNAQKDGWKAFITAAQNTLFQKGYSGIIGKTLHINKSQDYVDINDIFFKT
jgi:hypothetical protein